MGIQQRLRFLAGYLRAPSTVGAISPSSRALARALCEPYRATTGPVSVLEVGAGTGAVTRHLGTILGEQDRLDICELDSDFATVLEDEVLSKAAFAPAVAEGRVQVLCIPMQEIPKENRYDFIVSGLPLTAFELEDVHEVFRTLRRCLKPGGVLSYFEYIGLRRTSRILSVGKRRRRIRGVSSFLNENIRNHQVGRRSVLGNFPPAHARYFQFDG